MRTLEIPATQAQPPAALQQRLADLTARRDILLRAIEEIQPPPGGQLSPRDGIARNRLVQDLRAINLDIEMTSLERGRLGVSPAPPAIPATPVVPAIPPNAGTLIPPRQGPDFGLAELGGLAMVLVLGPLAVAIAWRIIRRGGPGVTKREFSDMSDRLRRIEEAVDTIAIETERVSEGQRFITRALGQGEAKPISVPGAVPEVARKARAADGT